VGLDDELGILLTLFFPRAAHRWAYINASSCLS